MTNKTFIIAEAGINHMGSLGVAKDLAYAAKDSGADAVKFQTYTTEKRVPADSPIYDILKQCELSHAEQAELAEYCKGIDMEFFSTPFDDEALAFLVQDVGVSRIKIASFDVTNRKFLSAINQACRKNPRLEVIMSVGMANKQEISEGLRRLDRVNALSLLHCISSYPTPDYEVNLAGIDALSRVIYPYVTRIGYSDHTSGVKIPALSVLAGAKVIEKHFTLDLNNGAVDNPVSADPKMMREMVDQVREYEKILGDGSIGMREVERAATAFRRSS